MTDPRNISIKDYTYSLPEERIANHPLPERDASRLLIYEDGHITEAIYRNIADHIPEKSVMVFNNTKVIEARLLFQKPTGGVIEIFCLEPHEQYADITTAMIQEGKVHWHCLVGGASKWKNGQVLEKKIRHQNIEVTLQAVYKEKRPGSFIIEFSWTPQESSFAEILHLAGAIPLPPYIKRKAEPEDAIRYQTLYADHEGSVAAPTAGLHFTQHIFDDLGRKKIQRDDITLHVGAGTFKPVKSEFMLEHEMHAEFFEVHRSVIKHILENLENKIVAVGTTSLRTIESLYWMGVKQWAMGAHAVVGIETSFAASRQWANTLAQWEAYELEKYRVPVKIALESLLEWMDRNNMEKLIAKTQILIAPGYSFKIVNGLVTNFHQPRSTLLLLVAAFVGEDLLTGQAGWRKIYEYALQHGFRFLSYGDGCLLWKN